MSRLFSFFIGSIKIKLKKWTLFNAILLLSQNVITGRSRLKSPHQILRFIFLRSVQCGDYRHFWIFFSNLRISFTYLISVYNKNRYLVVPIRPGYCDRVMGHFAHHVWSVFFIIFRSLNQVL